MQKTYIYKASGLGELIHGIKCETKIVGNNELNDYLNNGWAESPQEAANLGTQELPFTRHQLEEEAKKLNISFNANIKDKNLLARVKQALAALES